MMPSDCIDLYLLPTAGLTPDDMARLAALLDGTETARAARLRDADARADFVAAHGLLRLALSRHRPSVAPAAWRFEAGPFGKPGIVADAPSGRPVPSLDATPLDATTLDATPLDATSLHAPASGAATAAVLAEDRLSFSLTHTDRLVAVAVATGRDVGVDAEAVAADAATSAVAETFCTPAELQAFDALDEGDRRARFFALWTLKESILKAAGKGFLMPPQDLEIGFSPPAARWTGGETPWQAWHGAFGTGHHIAVCVAAMPAAPRLAVLDAGPMVRSTAEPVPLPLALDRLAVVPVGAGNRAL